MTKTLSLLCLISSELSSNAFKVKIDVTSDVSDLKDVVIVENPRAFEHIDANDLVLWHVTIPVDEDVEDEIITTDKVNAKRLLKGTGALSKKASGT
ncbi:hypothetical protein BG011_007948 [Mortierella polycephala]|uniref:Crinkler effector protein N-terminal domain-containing protein n=1 Tax=Mortierella polycephala TaxID=41804 RepID=A0A9P6PRG5_9FUNG|nr:hypothetical protein BG011_007948 [Mortierella polycephala]